MLINKNIFLYASFFILVTRACNIVVTRLCVFTEMCVMYPGKVMLIVVLTPVKKYR